MNSSVVSKILNAKKGNIGLLQLNAEKTLNSLTLEMVQQIATCLTNWKNDNNIATIILLGNGDRAFCAGGDVQQLYQSAISKPGGPCSYAEEFFLNEYALNYQIHNYPKPIICLGNGFVMGGGLGLMAGASHRVATETTRIAMPEITIGLFPDVGGTWFLNKMPDDIGLFFALTGAAINASDALYTGLANHIMPWGSRDTLIENLLDSSWNDNHESNHALVDTHLKAVCMTEDELADIRSSEIKTNVKLITESCQQNSLAKVIVAISQLNIDNKWINKAKSTLASGSPLSSLLIYEQLKRHCHADLKTVFLSELQLATNIIRYPEFSEGVRALLIDKDNKPNWHFKHFNDVPTTLLEMFFSAPWPINPLEFKLTNSQVSLTKQ